MNTYFRYLVFGIIRLSVGFFVELCVIFSISGFCLTNIMHVDNNNTFIVTKQLMSYHTTC